MAINIFSGNTSPGKSKKVNAASNSDRAKQAKAALAASAPEASSSGGTAVGSKGSLAKIGNTVGKIAGVVGKFLPGIGGTIANGLSNILNDPEWWQSTPGDAITLNDPLRFIEDTDRTEVTVAYGQRSAILEFTMACSTGGIGNGGGLDGIAVSKGIFTPSQRMITQYLMPQIRRVVNAIPLQSALKYQIAISAGATIYAYWRQLKKYDYMLKHGQTYLANMNDNSFPLFQTKNASWLQSTINRLEEYLRANIRLPHTLCEYLAWRYGRVYKSNDSAKSALVLHDALPITATPSAWDAAIARQMDAVALDVEVQKANTDMFNTYFDHDYMVEVRDDTQFSFDKKEFMLRLNLNGAFYTTNGNLAVSKTKTAIAIDSNLDNPTAFMASTVSAIGKETGGDDVKETLFPVSYVARVYIPGSTTVGLEPSDATYIPSLSINVGGTTAVVLEAPKVVDYLGTDQSYPVKQYADTIWLSGNILMDQVPAPGAVTAQTLVSLILSKAVDLYNYGVHVSYNWKVGETSRSAIIDVSTLSIDSGTVTGTTLNTEHVYAFANLVDIDRRHSMSYKQAEHLVARDTADLIDKLDVASSTATK